MVVSDDPLIYDRVDSVMTDVRGRCSYPGINQRVDMETANPFSVAENNATLRERVD